jgi:hypothetical protein
VNIVFLLGFGMAMQYPCKFQIYVVVSKGFMGYRTKGITCALSIFGHEYYPFNTLNQNNLTHDVY